MEAYSEQILRIVVAQISQAIGWDSIMPTPLECLVHVLRKYIQDLSIRSLHHAELCRRSEVSIMDVNRALCDVYVDLSSLLEYMVDFGSLPCAVHVPHVPVKVPSSCIYDIKRNIDNVSFADERKLAKNQGKENVLRKPEDNTENKTCKKRVIPAKQGKTTACQDIAAAKVLVSLQKLRSYRHEEHHLQHDLKSLWMSPSGFILPSTEGKVPDSKIPAAAEHDPIRIRITKEKLNHYVISFMSPPEGLGSLADQQNISKVKKDLLKKPKFDRDVENLEGRRTKYKKMDLSRCNEAVAKSRDTTLSQDVSDSRKNKQKIKLVQKCTFGSDLEILPIRKEQIVNALPKPDLIITSTTADFVLKKPKPPIQCAELKGIQSGMPLTGMPANRCCAWECSNKPEINTDPDNGSTEIARKVMSGQSVTIGSTSVHLVEHNASPDGSQCTNSLWDTPCRSNGSLLAYNNVNSFVTEPAIDLPQMETQSISIFPLREQQMENKSLLPVSPEANMKNYLNDTTLHSVSLIPIPKNPRNQDANSIGLRSQEIHQSNFASTIGGLEQSLNITCMNYGNGVADNSKFCSVDTPRYNLRQRYIQRLTKMKIMKPALPPDLK